MAGGDATAALAQLWLDERRRTAEQTAALIEDALANYRPRGRATLAVGLPVPTLGEGPATVVAFPCVVLSLTLLADAAGTLSVDLLRAPTVANYAAADTASVTGGAGIALAGARAAEAPAAGGWSPVLVAGAVLVPTVLACSGVTVATLNLVVRRT